MNLTQEGAETFDYRMKLRICAFLGKLSLCRLHIGAYSDTLLSVKNMEQHSKTSSKTPIQLKNTGIDFRATQPHKKRTNKKRTNITITPQGIEICIPGRKKELLTTQEGLTIIAVFLGFILGNDG